MITPMVPCGSRARSAASGRSGSGLPRPRRAHRRGARGGASARGGLSGDATASAIELQERLWARASMTRRSRTWPASRATSAAETRTFGSRTSRTQYAVRERRCRRTALSSSRASRMAASSLSPDRSAVRSRMAVISSLNSCHAACLLTPNTAPISLQERPCSRARAIKSRLASPSSRSRGVQLRGALGPERLAAVARTVGVADGPRVGPAVLAVLDADGGQVRAHCSGSGLPRSYSGPEHRSKNVRSCCG
jgi:hypothetical protein